MKTRLVIVLMMSMLLVSGCSSGSKMIESAAGDLVNQLTGSLGDLSGLLSGITDLSSAQDLLPDLKTIDKEIGDMAGKVGNMPADTKTELGSVVDEHKGEIEESAGAAYAIPGVTDVIKPTMDSIMGNLAKF